MVNWEEVDGAAGLLGIAGGTVKGAPLLQKAQTLSAEAVSALKGHGFSLRCIVVTAHLAHCGHGLQYCTISKRFPAMGICNMRN